MLFFLKETAPLTVDANRLFWRMGFEAQYFQTK